jgi:transposase
MEVLYPRCAGLDVHKDTVVACVRIARGTKVTRELRTFGTTTRELRALADWLEGHAVTHVAMESTGVFWKPVWHVLEGLCTLILGNAQEIRNVPGRKSDTNDATWIADLLAHGLIRASFVPPAPIQELRDLTRTRKQLVRERSQHVQRLQKVLEDANVKLASVVSDVLGQSGRAVVEALIAGQTDPAQLVALTSPRLKISREALRDALQGRVTRHHRFLLQVHLTQIDALDHAIGTVEAQTAAVLAPFRPAVERLCTIPGVSATTAHVLLAEIGADMRPFPTAGHLVSWAGLCPRLDESAGKRRSTRVRHGNPWLKTSLVQAAWSGIKGRDSYLHAQFHRLKTRRGAKKAIVAVAASMLTAAYHMLRDDLAWRDLGADYFDRHQHQRLARRLVHRLTQLGYHVEIQEAA